MPTGRVLQLGFLASHRGTNLQAILDACKTGRLQARPQVVISNNSDSGALQRARKMGVPSAHLSTYTHPEPGALDRAILALLDQVQVPVEPGDSVEALSARVLQQEHLLYVRTLQRIATGEIELQGL